MKFYMITSYLAYDASFLLSSNPTLILFLCGIPEMKQNTKKEIQPTLKIVRVTFETPSELRKSFKVKAAQEERSVKDALCALMEAYVKNQINLDKKK